MLKIKVRPQMYISFKNRTIRGLGGRLIRYALKLVRLSEKFIEESHDPKDAKFGRIGYRLAFKNRLLRDFVSF